MATHEMCPQRSRNKAWSILRIFFVEISWYRYAAHVFIWRTINLRYSRQTERNFITHLLRKLSPGTGSNHSKILLHQHLKKMKRSMLLFKLDISHARMDLLLPRLGSKLNKSQLPNKNVQDSEPLCELHFKFALFLLLFFAIALFFS